MPQVAGGEIRERARRLRETGEAALRRRLQSEISAVRDVLIESTTAGRTEHFVPMAIAGEVPGTVRRLTVTGHDGVRLTGQ
jgi:threonylcarbamoyladenosine tRNA methylthiotransferase MtaB